MMAMRTTSLVVERCGSKEGMTDPKDRQKDSKELKVNPLLAKTFTCAAQILASAPGGIDIVWTREASRCTFGALGVQSRPDRVATESVLMSMSHR